MASLVQRLAKKQNLIHPPKWLPDNIHYEVIGGSESYGVSSGSSDVDVVGFCIPEKKMIFSHIGGEIMGFGTPTPKFDVWQEHHIKTDKKEYDFAIYSIVKLFQLAMENNPNMLDVLFTPQRCVLFATKVANHLRDNRKLFLHKGSYFKFTGYARSQLHKMNGKRNPQNEKRKNDIEKFGYDTKYLYHLVRLLLESEQILVEHDLDIERNSEMLKAIRRGEWSKDDVLQWFEVKERSLTELYSSSTLQHKPDEEAIKRILLQCLEMHYGDLSNAIVMKTEEDVLATEMFALLRRLGYNG